MPQILDLPEVRARVSRLSLDAYEALDEMGALEKRAELIRGVIVNKTPKSPLHCKLIKWIYDHCRDQRPPGHIVFQERPLRLADSMPEPGIIIVRGRESDFHTQHPTTAALVIEIAVSSAALDRENASLYAEAGVAEYWIVFGIERQVEVYRRPENGVYRQTRLYLPAETLECENIPGLQVPLAEWFA